MNRLLQTLILAIFLVLMHAVWQPAKAATAFCEGLACARCENDLNIGLASIAPPYAFVCGHDGGGYLSLAFSEFLGGGGLTLIFADYDGFNNSCDVFVDKSVTGTGQPIDNPEVSGMNRASINAWKKVLREVCRNY